MSWYGWKPYVPVAKRRQQAKKKMDALRRRGSDVQPIEISGRKIAKTFWGEAWCEHLESFSDYANRLPRGRTYVRNGSVCHLAVTKGNVDAKVSGSTLYSTRVRIKTVPAKKWRDVKRRCAGQIGSLLELLRGDLSDKVMQVVCDRQKGLFPLPGEIAFDCDCPDWASMCKHVAAVLYGVGARLDQNPALLFRLRGVDHEELIDADAQLAVPKAGRSRAKRIAKNDLADVFGIELTPEVPKSPSRGNGKPKRSANSQTKSTPSRKKKVSSKKSAKSAAARKQSTKTGRRKAKSNTAVSKSPAQSTPKKKSPARSVSKNGATSQKKRKTTRKAATSKLARKARSKTTRAS